MASEIKVDTISEKTSANGVTIDGVNIKDSALATAGSVPLSTIDIDGGTDIGAAIVDADLFIIDDGAGGTNRKTAASRLKTYIGGSDPASADGDTLGTASLEWSDLYLADSSVIYFGNDQDTTLTHTDGTGLTLNSTNKLCFNDASQFIQGASGTVLDIAATDEIELTATEVEMNVTTLDVNGNVDVSGTTLLPTLGVVTAKDLGNGIHIKISDAGAVSGGLNIDADDFVIEHSGSGGMTILSGTSNTGAINFADSGNANAGLVRYDHANDSMDFFTAGTERANITSNGLEVTNGIGIVTAKDLGSGLHIKISDTGADVHSSADELIIERNGDNGMTFLNSTSGESFINFGDSGDNDIGQMSYHHSSNHMAFKTNASEAMRIHSSGKISMGSTSTAGGFHVMYDAGNSTSQGSIAVSSDNTGAATGIIFFDGDNHNCGRISVLGSSNEIAIYGESSDYRLKKDIADMDSSWELIKSLKPRKFKWKDNEELGYHNSFIAHELQEIIPKAVSGEKDAMTPEVLYTADDELPEGKNIGDVKEETKIDPQFIATAGLTTYLTNALKEAITKIETLEAKVAVLEG